MAENDAAPVEADEAAAELHRRDLLQKAVKSGMVATPFLVALLDPTRAHAALESGDGCDLTSEDACEA